MTSVTWTDRRRRSPAARCTCRAAAAARPLLVLHHDIGTLDRLPFYDALAGSFDVLVPHHPGWGKSERPQWLRHPRDIAAMHHLVAGRARACATCRWWGWASAAGSRRKWRAWRRPRSAAWCWWARWASSRRRATSPTRRSFRISTIRRPASTTRRAFERVYGDVEHRPAGSTGTSRARCVSAPRGSPTCTARPCRICWAACRRRRWWCGATTTASCRCSAGDAYAQALRDARLETVAACGHLVDMEKPDELARLVTEFVNAN